MLRTQVRGRLWGFPNQVRDRLWISVQGLLVSRLLAVGRSTFEVSCPWIEFRTSLLANAGRFRLHIKHIVPIHKSGQVHGPGG